MTEETDTTVEAAPSRPLSVIAAGVLFQGDIEGATDLHVQGRVVGKISVDDLTISADSLVQGSITAKAVTIAGRVTGPIKAQSVHLLPTAHIYGDLSCANLQMDDGACFTGRCDAEETGGAKVVPMFRSSDGGAGQLLDAGQELLNIAARLRGI